MHNFNIPDNWIKIKTLDAHTAGEPLRIILEGYPELKGNTILEKRRDARENYDKIRTALMFEPRGHADMYGAVIIPPVTPEADFGVLFLHNEGYSTMCGHAIIAITKVFIETNVIKAVTPVTTIKIDSPVGLITSHARCTDGKITSVFFHNVPSFVLMQDKSVEVEGLGKVKFDIAYGGAFYAFVNADDIGIEMIPDNYRSLIEKGMDIKRAVMNNFEIKHPFEEDLNFLYGTIFYGKSLSDEADSRNVCIFAEGEVDRSPTGTGVSARMALHHAKGELNVGDSMTIESILGTTFKGTLFEKTKYGPFDAVIPEVEGTAYITGRNELLINPDDPLHNGFILR
ncbi:proline racemase family protein [Bacteroidota bacterium]